jgi:hypothetical protein
VLRSPAIERIGNPLLRILCYILLTIGLIIASIIGCVAIIVLQVFAFLLWPAQYVLQLLERRGFARFPDELPSDATVLRIDFEAFKRF